MIVPINGKYIGRLCSVHNSGLRYACNGACVECVKAHGKARVPTKRTRKPEERKRAQQRYLAKPDKRIKHQAHIRNRRARVKNCGGSHTGEQIEALYRLQHGRCCYCRTSLASGFDADHIIPVLRGGSNSITNIQLACRSCNRKKSYSDPLVFARQINLLV